jgi:hypothetical protein
MWRLLADARSASTRLGVPADRGGSSLGTCTSPRYSDLAVHRAILGCLYLALRPSRPALAWAGFAAGFVAGYCYLTAIVFGSGAAGQRAARAARTQPAQAIISAAGAAAGFGAVR